MQEDISTARKDAAKMEQEARKWKNQTEEVNRSWLKNVEKVSEYTSLLALISMVALSAMWVGLVVVVSIPGLIPVEHRNFIIAVLLVLLAGVITILWLARKNVYILLPMLIFGYSLFSFAFGYVYCSF